MLNVFYNPSYFTSIKGSLLITRRVEFSIFIHILIRLLYIFNLPYPAKITYTGPQMRMNHLIKTYKRNKNICFNTHKYSNNYIVQFDYFGEKVLKKIIKKRTSDTKIIIGPLFKPEMDKVLNQYMKEYSFIKKIVASEAAMEAQKKLHKDLDLNDVFICPSGIEMEKNLITSIQSEQKIFDCLIYFKKRDLKELELVKNFLVKKNISYKVLEYGEYSNNELIELSNKVKFGFILDKTETQGFAIQYLMSNNIPLIVWDYTTNEYEGFKIESTSVPWWESEQCGIKIFNIEELENKFDHFIANLTNYNPVRFVIENLTYEKFRTNLNSLFINEDIWIN
jgi:hypothetical protein